MITKANINDPHTKKVERPGTSGLNHLWDGPFDTSNLPMGKGSSSGKNGMEVKKYPCKDVNPGLPITQRAKQ